MFFSGSKNFLLKMSGNLVVAESDTSFDATNSVSGWGGGLNYEEIQFLFLFSQSLTPPKARRWTMALA